jgi:hypothetical protein
MTGAVRLSKTSQSLLIHRHLYRWKSCAKYYHNPFIAGHTTFFGAPLAARMVSREKRIQQDYRP